MAAKSLEFHVQDRCAREDPEVHTDRKKANFLINTSTAHGAKNEATIGNENSAVEEQKLNTDYGAGRSFADAEMMFQIRNETAAVEVQRFYRGYRARRGLADAATIAHRFGWWNVVEGAMLECQSSLFYAYNTPQSASQRWMRLKKKAAKLGRGLSKNEKARKLALQHWLEAIDPRHRYGHNLHFYYEKWSQSETGEPFFYWLDIGEGNDVDLKECKRSKLQKECIRYMSPAERQYYEVIIANGKLRSKMTRELVNTPKGDKWIFVMSTTGKLYVAKKEKGKLQHSSFLAGGCTTAAGRLLVKDGIIELMEAHSGHYLPTAENFHELIKILTSGGADLTVAKMQFVSDDLLSPKSVTSDETTVKENVQDVQNEVVNDKHFSGDLNAVTTSYQENPSPVEEVIEIHDTQHTLEDGELNDKESSVNIATNKIAQDTLDGSHNSRDIPDADLQDSLFHLQEISIEPDIPIPPNSMATENAEEGVVKKVTKKYSRSLSSQQRLLQQLYTLSPSFQVTPGTARVQS